MINKGFLHYIILKHIIDKGFAPRVDTFGDCQIVDAIMADLGKQGYSFLVIGEILKAIAEGVISTGNTSVAFT